MAKYINITGEAIVIKDHIFPPAKYIATVSRYTSLAGYDHGIPLFFETFGQILPPLPEPEENTYFIVTEDVKQAAGRPDFVAVRYKDGKAHGFIIP